MPSLRDPPSYLPGHVLEAVETVVVGEQLNGMWTWTRRTRWERGDRYIRQRERGQECPKWRPLMMTVVGADVLLLVKIRDWGLRRRWDGQECEVRKAHKRKGWRWFWGISLIGSDVRSLPLFSSAVWTRNSTAVNGIAHSVVSRIQANGHDKVGWDEVVKIILIWFYDWNVVGTLPPV